MGKIFKNRNFIRIVIVLLFACILGTAMSFLFNNTRRTAQAALTGSGTEKDPVKIYSVADLQEFATRVNNGTDNYWDATKQEPKYVKLMSDIDLSTIANWTPIGNTNAQAKSFNGVFDGNNKTISNLTINNTSAAYSGLFGYLYGGTIKNLKLSNPNVYSTKTNLGALVGYIWAGAGGKVNNVATNRFASIENCHLIGGNIWCTTEAVGGLIGRIDSTNNATFDHGVVVKNCTIKGTGTNYVPTTVMGTNLVGGIVGYATGVKWQGLSTGAEQCGVHIINCYSTATITDIASGYSGGLVGRASGMLMEQCYSTGAVRSIVSGSTGGLVGYIGDNASKVTDCFAMGDVNAVGTATADKTKNGWAYAGGIVGEITIATSEVLNCLYTGTVLGCSLWSYDNAYYSGTAAGIIGRISVNTVYVGGCAVDSPRVSGIGQSSATGLSSPVANGWGTNVWPAFKTVNGNELTNVYYKDMLIGEQRGGRWDTCTKVSGQKVDADAFKQQTTYEKTLGWNIKGGSRIWGIGTSFNNGYPYLSNCPNSNQIEYPYGHRFNPIIIATPDDFQQIADNVNTNTVAAPKELYGGLHLKQTADLDMTGVSVVGNINNTSSAAYRRNTFRGDYDGGLFRLQNVKIVSTFNNLGIFGAVMNGTFRNIVVENPMVNNETGATSHAGILVGCAWGNLYIDNCAILGGQLAVPKMARAGALVGACWYKGNYIMRSFSSAQVTAGNTAGGLIGFGVGIHMSQCYCSGNVDTLYSSAVSNTRGSGGLVGELHMPHEGGTTWNYDESLTANPAAPTGQATIDNCYAVNNVSMFNTGKTDNGVGGIAGRALGNATVTNCYFRGGLTIGGNPTNAYATNIGGIVGISLNANVAVNNCLSVITKAQFTTTAGNSRVMGYYNTYRATVPQAAMNCFYVPLPADEFPTNTTTAGGGATIDGGIATTVEEIKAGKIFGEKYSYTVTTPGENEGDPPTTTTINADGLNWDMKNIWLQNANANDGFPMLRGLIVDTTELDAVIAEARTYDRENYSEETFSALEKLMDAAKKEIADHTLTEESKVQYMEAIVRAISNLCPDVSKLSELYDRVNKDMLPYKEFYVSFTLVDSLLPGAKELIENAKNFYQNDITSLYEALKLAVDNLRVDKSQLNKAIERANAIMLNAESYPQEQIKKLDSALKAAVNVNNDNTVLAPQVNNATKQLQDALEGVQLDKTGLLNLIIESYAYIGVEVKYDVDLGDTDKTIIVVNEDNRVMSLELKNYDDFEEALDNAEKVLYNSEAPSQTILNAQFDLEIAKKALKLKTDKLEDLSSQAAALLINEKYYTADSIAKLKAEKEKADAIIEGTTATETIAARRDRYDATCKSLEAALKVEINKTELMQTITRAKAENKNELYTDETFNKLQDEISKAQAIYDKSDSTVKEVYDAISALNDALQNLNVSLDYIKDLVKQARYILDNDGVRALYTSGIEELEKRTEKAEEICKLNASEANVTDVKNASRLLQSALDALKVSKDELNRYIAMGIIDWSDDYIKDGVYSEESTDAYRELAQQAQNAISSMTDAEVAAWTLRLKNAFENLKANSDKLSTIVNRISAMSNKKYRQDNDGKWIVDEDTGNMKIFVIYEDKSWKVLETELLKAKELLLNSKATPKQIDDACKALEAAEAGLIVDTSELELRMQKALDLLAQEDLYTDASIFNLQEVYDAAKALLDNAKETGEKLVMSAVQKCLDDLLVAIDSMEADTFAIYSLLDIAKGLLDYKDYCTKATAANLQSSYDQVNSLLDKGAELDASSVAVLAQMLTDAMKGLVITTEKLQEFIGYYDFLVEYKEYLENFDAFSSYIKEFRKLLTGNKLKITTYTEAVEKLETYSNAIGALTSAYTALRPNWTAYEGLVSDGKGMLAKALQVEGTDTAALEAALEEADALLSDKPETYDEMLSSIQALKAALQSLKALELDELVKETKAKMASEVVLLDGESGPETKLSDFYGAGATVSVVYTTASYRALQNALKQGEDVLKIANPSYDAVDGAIAAINAAMERLVVDPALINHLIKECDDLYVEAYYETEDNQYYDDYCEKLADCKEIIKDPTTSLEDYLNAYKDLVEAKSWLEFKSNVLADIIAKAEAKLAEDGPKCTESSKTALQVQIVAAKACTATSGSSDYNDACNALLDAMANLTYIDELQAEIKRVEPFIEFGNPDEVGNFYSVGSFKDLCDLFDKAKSLVTKEGLRQYEVDSMVKQLKVCDDPENGLLLNVTAYKKIVEEHQAFIDKNKGMYTDETWNPYVADVERLADLIKLSKYEVTTEQIEEAIQEAEDAKNDLEKDLNKKFMLKASNTTFKFIYDDGKAVENYAEHQYEADKPIYLKNIAMNDSVADIVAQFDNLEVKAFNAKGEEITDLSAQVVATGIVLRIMAGDQILDQLTLVLTGDVNGDGKVNAVDGSQLNSYFKGAKQFDKVYLLAGDVNGDGKVNAVDGSQLNSFFKGTKKLFDGLSVKGAA